jgi:hypothetical protein
MRALEAVARVGVLIFVNRCNMVVFVNILSVLTDGNKSIRVPGRPFAR